jgi:hypothetical protein
MQCVTDVCTHMQCVTDVCTHMQCVTMVAVPMSGTARPSYLTDVSFFTGFGW